MRNNPRHCDFPESSPYMRGLKQVLEDLRDQVVDIKDNRLAKLKIETKERNKMRIQVKKQLLVHEKRDKQILLAKYEEWIRRIDGTLELALVQNILVSFLDHPMMSSQGKLRKAKWMKMSNHLNLFQHSSQFGTETKCLDLKGLDIRICVK
eukprot:gi/632965594/ref/XP_007898968.1/ PREDICTED: EF-hand calcium-binding domain-containing protein 5-like isoform X3 [Callorhinchus milii]